MKILVISCKSNSLHVPLIVELRELGHVVFDAENQIDTPIAPKDLHREDITIQNIIARYNLPVFQEWFQSYMKAAEDADICFIVFPASAFALALATYMKGRGKQVYAFVQNTDYMLRYFMFFDKILSELDELKDIPQSV